MICEQDPVRGGYQNTAMNPNTRESVRELLKSTEKRRVSVMPEDALTGSMNTQSSREINTAEQLQYWANKDSEAFLEILREHQLKQNQAINSLEDYN